MPNVRWVLLGDDGGHDPQVFVDFAHRHRDRVAVIGVAAGVDVDSPRINCRPARRPVDAAVVGAPNGEELLPLVRAALGIGQPRRARSRTGSSRSSSAATRPPASGRGPRATRCARWCTDVCTTTPWRAPWPRRATATRSSSWGGGRMPISSSPTAGRRSARRCPGRPVVARRCAGCCGTPTPTWWDRRSVRTGRSPSPSTGRAERCCWTSGCSRSAATTRRWSSSATPAAPRTTWRSSAASTSTTAAATTPITVAIGRAWEPIPSTDPTRPTTTCNWSCRVRWCGRRRRRSASGGRTPRR